MRQVSGISLDGLLMLVLVSHVVYPRTGTAAIVQTITGKTSAADSQRSPSLRFDDLPQLIR